jgi:hypothetical protein
LFIALNGAQLGNPNDSEPITYCSKVAYHTGCISWAS